MERLALIGVSHRRGGAAALEAWQQYFDADRLANLRALGFAEWVPLVTCNRWDVLVGLESTLDIDEARRRLTPPGQHWRPYAYVGDGALEQISRIAASLDSLNPGEDQIMAQVREAFKVAQSAGSTGKITSFAMHTALRIAKRVRREVALAPVNTSLFSLARPRLEQVLPPCARVAVIGAGDMGTLAAKSLADQAGVELLIVNRSPERARQLAKHLQARCMSLEQFLQHPPPLEALVCTTPVAHLINAPVLQQLPELRIIIDLGLPRNVDHHAAAARGLEVLDVDSLQSAGAARRDALMRKLAEAEQLVQDEVEAAVLEWTERQLGPAIKKLRDWYLETIGDALEPAEAAKLAHKFAHVPIKGLRAVAREHGLEAAQTFLEESGLV